MQQKSLCLLLILIGFTYSTSQGQGNLDKWLRLKPDSSYVKNNQHDLILRVYASQKYSSQTIIDHGEKMSLDYRPSNGYLVGLGFNYKFLGINIGTIFPFAQPDINRYGKTKYLDFQSHLYLRFLTVDFYTGYYKGFYLANSASVLNTPPQMNDFYTRGISQFTQEDLACMPILTQQNIRLEHHSFRMNGRRKVPVSRC